MGYTCSLCKQSVAGDLMVYKMHTEGHIVDLVKHDHPDWVESDGMCQKCLKYYEDEIKGSVLKDAACALRQRRVNRLFSWVKNIFKSG